MRADGAKCGRISAVKARNPIGKAQNVRAKRDARDRTELGAGRLKTREKERRGRISLARAVGAGPRRQSAVARAHGKTKRSQLGRVRAACAEI